MNILITGANGFVGNHLAKYLTTQNHSVIAGARHTYPKLSQIKQFTYTDFSPSSAWQANLTNINVIVHCAARVHVLNDNSTEPLTAYRDVNTLGTIELAKQALQAGVKRFVFISTIKVNGESTELGKPFKETDKPKPTDPYAVSKLEAEVQLAKLVANQDMELVIIRPPLVYGVGVKANFASMINLIKTQMPMPFANIRNQRSFVSITNLCHFISICCQHPNAVNSEFLVSDGEDLSTPELFKLIANAYSTKARLFALPTILLNGLGRLLFINNRLAKLTDNLQLDISKAKTELNWQPKETMAQALKHMAKNNQRVIK